MSAEKGRKSRNILSLSQSYPSSLSGSQIKQCLIRLGTPRQERLSLAHHKTLALQTYCEENWYTKEEVSLLSVGVLQLSRLNTSLRSNPSSKGLFFFFKKQRLE